VETVEKAMKEIRLSELRSLENTENDEMILEGYAVVFDRVTDISWYKEIISRDAFNNCDMSDCVLKYNHNDSALILARTRNKSIEFTIDTKGLLMRAKLIDTTNNKDIYKMVQEGLLDKMSFKFSVAEEKWDYETDTRTILAFERLFDVSIVDFPAYEGTEIFARSKEQFEEEKTKYQELKLEKERLKLKLSI
jgi:HK97 family phage prohead protease